MLASAKSMDDEAARRTLLRDPKRVAVLLARAFSSSVLDDARRQEEDDEEVEETQEEFQDLERRASASAAPLRVVIRPAAEEDEEDADEADEEEDDDEDEGEDADKPLDEEELEAAAAALQAATRIVEELRLKMLLKDGRQMDRQLQESDSEPPFSSAGSVLMTPPLVPRSENHPAPSGGPGVPVPRARARYNSGCQGCGKSFNPFNRSKNCAACGHAFCPKCSSKNVVLPSSFGYRDESVRTCDLCAKWVQKTLDRYFDAVEMAKVPEQDSSVHRGSMGEIMIEEKPRASSAFSSSVVPTSVGDGVLAATSGPRSSVSSPDPIPTYPDEENAADGGENDEQHVTSISSTSTSRRRHRHGSISSTPSPLMIKNKPWFSGHLRAMHVSDRLPRKKKARGNSECDTENNSPELRSYTARRSRLGSVASAPSKTSEERQHLIEDTSGNSRTCSESEGVLASVSKSASTERGRSSLIASDKPAESSKNNDSNRPRRKARRSKFSRSASFDLTNLSVASPDSLSGSPGMKRCNTFGPDEARSIAVDVVSNGSSHSGSMRSMKAFDDSDIVDKRAKLDSAEVKLKSEANLSAAVLRFAVYEMGAKENTGLRRTFGFAKANPVLDRYTLELDCRQRIVRAKSVFMHRFWSFHCDSVQSFVFGSSEGMARLIVFNGGQGNQSLELKFADDDEREEFKQAMDSCRSTNLDEMRGLASQSGMSLRARPEPPASPVPDNLRSPTSQEPSTTFSGDTSTSIESELGLVLDTIDSSIDSPVLQTIHVPLLPGEVVVKDTELLATLLIGPASETFETTLIWGRLRGKIAVTNYRVVFIPFDRVRVQPRHGGQGGIAYIPLFAITQAQLLYPGGRRTKSGRTYYAGMASSASIISISCKDIRVMRFQLDTHPSVSDDHTHKLRATIVKMVDASQRYIVVERGSISRTSSPGLAPLTSTTSGSDTPPERDADTGVGSWNESNMLAYGSSRTPAYAASPVLRPDRILAIPREISGSFAFSYSIDNVSPDQNGWNVFVDEREFKRQIGGDPAVSPFLKVRWCCLHYLTLINDE
ncbi:unnamed protein product [Phytophthora fragariaefolia]|uniref:Unnamed protein product n=1 Tax=Phytophthora fragariaefolia TaxID=1490495 RepID=A0A9W6X0P6_9STRA|nr:unnamed protein product [Phytophthora fragariaefolia]